MTVQTLTDTASRALDALRLYRFLTIDQMVKLGVASRRKSINETLLDLLRRKHPAVARVDHGVLPGKGRLPSLYFLTPDGAELIAAAFGIDAAEIQTPRGVVSIRHDLMHRIHCVDCEIAARQWAERNGQRVSLCSSYFTYTGANRSKGKETRKAVTRVDVTDRPAVIPDVVLKLEDGSGTERLFLLEMFNQYRTKRMADKLAEYRFALGEGAISRAFAYPAAPRILSIFEDEKALENTQKVLSANADFGAEFYPYFFLSTLDGILSDFREGWGKIGDTRRHALF